MYNEQLKHELSKRWNALQTALERENGDALLVTSNVNLFYVSGRIFSGTAYITPDREPLFFVRRPNGLKRFPLIFRSEDYRHPNICSWRTIRFRTTNTSDTKRYFLRNESATEHAC